MTVESSLAGAPRDGRVRVVIENVLPCVDGGRFAIKRVAGDAVSVEADCFADGHDVVACAVQWRRADADAWLSTLMVPLGNDRWRGTFNVALFSTDYTGIQLNFQQGVSPTIQNAGTARIRGGEVELSWAVTPMFHLDSSLGIINAEYTSVLPQSQVAASPLQAGVFPGAPLPKTPH